MQYQLLRFEIKPQVSFEPRTSNIATICSDPCRSCPSLSPRPSTAVVKGCGVCRESRDGDNDKSELLRRKRAASTLGKQSQDTKTDALRCVAVSVRSGSTLCLCSLQKISHSRSSQQRRSGGCHFRLRV